MEKEKPRKADHWEIKYALFVGGHEIVFGEDQHDPEYPYFVGDCMYNNPFAIPEYRKCIGTADYLEAVTEFADRIKAQAELVRLERTERGISNKPIGRDACLPGGLGGDIEGKLVVIRPEVMQRDKRTEDYQYFLAEHGNGCRAEARGLGVFGRDLFSGERGRWERPDVMGIADPNKLPVWAKARLEALYAEKETETGPRKKAEMMR
jgi:hypothetical protein